jgi:tetratricopeptide (TPR) repeat protein
VGALRNLEEAEREAADDPEVLARIAALYSASDAPPEFHAKAARMWTRVLALNPVDVRARFFVAIAPLLASEPSPEDLERILSTLDGIIRSDSEFEPARVRYFRAMALERLGRQQEAAKVYRDVMMLTAVAPFRSRADDAGLDAAIEAMRALGAARADSRQAPASREGGR